MWVHSSIAFIALSVTVHVSTYTTSKRAVLILMLYHGAQQIKLRVSLWIFACLYNYVMIQYLQTLNCGFGMGKWYRRSFIIPIAGTKKAATLQTISITHFIENIRNCFQKIDDRVPWNSCVLSVHNILIDVQTWWRFANVLNIKWYMCICKQHPNFCEPFINVGDFKL